MHSYQLISDIPAYLLRGPHAALDGLQLFFPILPGGNNRRAVHPIDYSSPAIFLSDVK